MSPIENVWVILKEKLGKRNMILGKTSLICRQNILYLYMKNFAIHLKKVLNMLTNLMEKE